MFHNKKYDFYDVIKHVKTKGSARIIVPAGYEYRKEIVTGMGKLNVYYFDQRTSKRFEIQTGDWIEVASRIITPISLSKYLRFHDARKPSMYDIEFKNNKFTVTKQELEKND